MPPLLSLFARRRPYALCTPPSAPPPSNPPLQSTLQHYVSHYSLNVGVYVQEFAIDEVAASILITHVNNNSHVFNRGMAWGGISGKTISGVQPSSLGNTDGLWAQRLLGRSWDGNRRPGEEVRMDIEQQCNRHNNHVASVARHLDLLSNATISALRSAYRRLVPLFIQIKKDNVTESVLT